MASRNVGLQKPSHPTPTGGGSSDRLAYRDIPAKTGGAEAPPSELPKTGSKNDEAAGSAGKLRLSSQEGTRDANLGHTFFDVDLCELYPLRS